ncbi:hypothetical protein QBC34DRAFT_323039 [Podospora aff. communis PSN243]|uniref:Rhodopsin domain-containing protein n=1 Tax=Podospora aff. communis PSN243 TaxID=3040156 RepID=A0AAV9GRL0_9PEZI|nr:hypothetical protein QBC34DRAFT_323039 [Podospora aff. communis PSN243]
MADSDNATGPPLRLPVQPSLLGYGSGPIGVPWGTDRGYSVDIMVSAVVTAFIGTVFVFLRFYTRRVIISVLNWEDWLIVGAQIFSVAMCAAFATEAWLGHGQHVYHIPLENFMPMGKVGWVAILLYELSLWCSQVSILLLFLRIWTFPRVNRAAYYLLLLVMAYNIFVVITVLTACVPLRAFWDFELQFSGRAYCHSKRIWWANTYLHVVTDFMIYMIPMPVILRARFPKRQKILLFVLFAFGFFVCLVSIIRTWMLAISTETMDFTFDNVAVAFWSCVETNATVCVACIMTFKPLLTRWFPNLVEKGPGQGNLSLEVARSGRVLTIGSRPVRSPPVDLERSIISVSRGAGHEIVDIKAD